jgi:hypothetical protein
MSNIDYKKLVSFGIKAPSGHNSQPWKFQIINNAIQIYPDRSRSLPAVDANDRELFISLGCATENVVLAAKAQGLRSQIEVLPDAATNTSSITIHFTEGLPADTLWLALIDKRQSNRSVYSGEPLTEAELKGLRSVELEAGVRATIVTDTLQKDRLIELVIAGNTVQMQDAAFKQELLSWIRFNRREAQATGDGLAYNTMGNPAIPFRAIGKLIACSVLTQDRQNLHNNKLLHDVSALVVFSVQDNNPCGWINLGRSFERMALVATRLGVAHSHFNQPFEVSGLQDKLKKLEFVRGNYPCLMIRLGHAKSMPSSFRRRIEDVLL